MGKMDFEFVAIPERLLPVLGEQDPGTRIFRRRGSESEYASWWDAVCEICGEEGSVSPGGVAMYARVSRAGVHKRMREGRLTAFLWHTVKGVSRWTGREKLEGNGYPFIYIPGIECRAWAKLIEERASKAEALAECVGDGDMDGSFLRAKGRKGTKRKGDRK